MTHLASKAAFEPTTDHPLTLTTSCLILLLRPCININQQLTELAKSGGKQAQSLNSLPSSTAPAEHKGKDPSKAHAHVSPSVTAMHSGSWASPCASLPACKDQCWLWQSQERFQLHMAWGSLPLAGDTRPDSPSSQPCLPSGRSRLPTALECHEEPVIHHSPRAALELSITESEMNAWSQQLLLLRPRGGPQASPQSSPLWQTPSVSLRSLGKEKLARGRGISSHSGSTQGQTTCRYLLCTPPGSPHTSALEPEQQFPEN